MKSRIFGLVVGLVGFLRLNGYSPATAVAPIFANRARRTSRRAAGIRQVPAKLLPRDR
jgi:hypothetical protein